MTSLLLVLCAAGVLASRRRGFRTVALMAALGIFLLAWHPFEFVLMTPLERPLPASPHPAGDGEAIVVLSGNVEVPGAFDPEPAAGEHTYLRCRHAAWLYAHWKPVPVVATGGPVQGQGGYVIDSADVMRGVLLEAGVPPARIWTENRSRSTYENAVNTAALLRSHGISRIALVTEAFHMRRAVKTFRRQGLAVTAAPCAFRTAGVEWGPDDLLPATSVLRYSDEAIHEWMGLIWYGLSGKA